MTLPLFRKKGVSQGLFLRRSSAYNARRSGPSLWFLEKIAIPSLVNDVGEDFLLAVFHLVDGVALFV